MREPLLHRSSDLFDQRHSVLHLTLGAISVLRTLRPLLRPDDAAARDLVRIDEPLVDDEVLLSLTLGIVAVSERLMKHRGIATIPRQAPSVEGAGVDDLSVPPVTPAPRELTR